MSMSLLVNILNVRGDCGFENKSMLPLVSGIRNHALQDDLLKQRQDIVHTTFRTRVLINVGLVDYQCTSRERIIALKITVIMTSTSKGQLFSISRSISSD